MARKLRMFAVLALAGALLAAAPTAFAQVEPGSGWKAYSPGFKLQQFGCGKINDLTFTLSTTNEPSTIAGAQLYQQMLKDVGIPTQLAQTDQTSLINQAIAGQV